MTKPAIRARGLSKSYQVSSFQSGRRDTLRDELMAGFGNVLGKKGRLTNDTFWALRDISFDIAQGDVVGIVGGNGAGKSTMLKLLSRITQPTEGYGEIYGRVASLLEVGTGFDRELTGRENTYMNGALLGMKKREIDRKFDEIVAFAEIEKFIDMPVKRYSSGMYLRLAFAVAAHLEADVLILDEVLAVGDAKFQARCLGKMSEVAENGRTVIFVSHNMAAVTRFCRQCLWLERGRLREIGNAATTVADYLRSGGSGGGERNFPVNSLPGSEYVQLLSVRTKNGRGQCVSTMPSNEPIYIELEYRTLRESTGLRLGVSLITIDGAVVFSTNDHDTVPEGLYRPPGHFVSRCELPANFLNNGQYFVSVGSDFPMVQSHFKIDTALSFQVENVGGIGSHIPDGRPGALRMVFPWNAERVN